MPVQQNIYSYTKKKSSSSGASPSVPSSVGGKGGSKKRKAVESDEDEDYDEDFIDEEEEEKPKKKTTKKQTKRKKEESGDEESDNENSIRTSKFTGKKKKKEKESFRYPFLINRQDAKRRSEGDLDYDKSTLYISNGDMSNLTPMEQQYWKVKRNHMDKVVFFKKGKFYELYEEDADIGKKEFDLKMTERINMRMAGVPEGSYNTYAKKFLSLGYDCVRVEQIETAEERNERKKEKKTQSSCVGRDICDITTVSTITDLEFIQDSHHKYLLCIKEDVMHARYGITFLDISMDTFYLGFVEDDNNRTQFNTLIHTINPSEIIIEKGQVSANTKKNVQISNKTVVREKKTCTELSQTEFTGFPTSDVTKYFLEEFSHISEDEVVKKYLNNDLVMASFGACLFYLKYLRKEDILQSKLAKFLSYDGRMETGNLVLDGQTLTNLDVKVNTNTGTREGTLISLMDNTNTPMGKRLLENWLTRPLKNAEEINDRYDAIEDIMNVITESQTLREQLSNVKDFERYLSYLYRESRKVQKEVTFDVRTNKRKIKTYLDALDSLRNSLTIIQSLQDYGPSVKSNALKRVINMPDLQEVDELLNSFETQFDRSKAVSEGIIERRDGFGSEYEKLESEIAQIEKEVQEFVDQLKDVDPSAKLKSSKTNTKQWFIDVKLDVNAEDLPDGFKPGKKTKNYRAYSHAFLDKKLGEYKLRQTKMDDIRQNQYREILNEFSTHDDAWKKLLHSISELDCLLSLYTTSSQEGYCRPVILPYTNKPILRVSQMRHPTVRTTSGFIPNDIILGGDNSCSIIVTGPNMGGKSTILRSSCIAVIMAQVGCFIPAASCEFTLVDRIFTRIGANDRIMAGESTFMVELTETSNIVRNATPRSLVILDELGRGTSTHDGYAIANSVIQYIADIIGCLCMFSTHYYELTEELKHHPNLDFYQMQCEVEKDETGKIIDVIFLYQFARGVCEKSYGIQVAKKAGVPHSIVDRASTVAEEFEQVMRIHRPITYDALKPEQEEYYQNLVATAIDISERDEMDESEQAMIVTILSEFQQKILMSYSDFSSLIQQKHSSN